MRRFWLRRYDTGIERHCTLYLLTDLLAWKADFSKAELSDAKFNGAALLEASFLEVVAPRADFSKASIASAKLCGATLTGASFAEVLASKV